MDQIGYSKEELMNMRPFDIKPEYNEAQFREVAEGLIRGPEHSVHFETIDEQDLMVELTDYFAKSSDSKELDGISTADASYQADALAMQK